MSFNELIRNESLAGMKRLLRTVKKQETLQNNVPMTFYGTISYPPLVAEINNIIDTPSNVGTDFVGLIVDSVGGYQFLVWTDANDWYYMETTSSGTSAVLGARVKHSLNQTIADSTGTILSFNSEDYDVGSFHDNTINNSRLTVPITGYYKITAQVSWQQDTRGYRTLQIVHSFAGVIVDSTIAPADGKPTSHIVTTDFYMQASEYIQVRVEQTSGGNLDIQVIDPSSPVFSIFRIK